MERRLQGVISEKPTVCEVLWLLSSSVSNTKAPADLFHSVTSDMQSGTMSEVSNYLQPDHFDSDKKNMNDFLDQNPLLLLARTCQNIGVETAVDSSKATSNGPASIKASNPFSVSSSFTKVPSGRPMSKSSTPIISSAQNFSPVGRTTPNSPKGTQQPSATSTHSAEESELYIPPSSNSLIQLARLSSSLKIPSPASTDRHKRTKAVDSLRYSVGANGALGASPNPGSTSRPQKRARRQSFGRNTSSVSSAPKPIDFSSHFSSHSSPLSTSSSVSPSSLRSTPPSHTTPPPQPPNSSSYDIMKNLMKISVPPESSPSALEAFYNVGSLLGASPERLRELLVTIAQSLTDRSATDSNLLLEQQQSKLQAPVSDLSTQCLYCGHVCLDMGSLVQHIYTHLASLHKQKTETSPVPPPPPPPPAPVVPQPNPSLLDLASCYARFLQKAPESVPQATSVPTVLPTPDPNSLFLAWLNVFRPTYSEALTGANR
ncbi:unnamed protein product [Mesocestoides corti]|uniref:C2H2-type domain-containing protein n=2 Tax=Mesocestoides corti TaxID=53468 RepID=A0A0R3U4P2_MESCO|nr:unnamed protein product [Mesocestoides corti]